MSSQPCYYFNSPAGCRNGDNCPHLHIPFSPPRSIFNNPQALPPYVQPSVQYYPYQPPFNLNPYQPPFNYNPYQPPFNYNPYQPPQQEAPCSPPRYRQDYSSSPRTPRSTQPLMSFQSYDTVPLQTDLLEIFVHDANDKITPVTVPRNAYIQDIKNNIFRLGLAGPPESFVLCDYTSEKKLTNPHKIADEEARGGRHVNEVKIVLLPAGMRSFQIKNHQVVGKEGEVIPDVMFEEDRLRNLPAGITQVYFVDTNIVLDYTQNRGNPLRNVYDRNDVAIVYPEIVGRELLKLHAIPPNRFLAGTANIRFTRENMLFREYYDAFVCGHMHPKLPMLYPSYEELYTNYRAVHDNDMADWSVFVQSNFLAATYKAAHPDSSISFAMVSRNNVLIRNLMDSNAKNTIARLLSQLGIKEIIPIINANTTPLL